MIATDSFLGFSTLALAVVTAILAGVAIWQLVESRTERQASAHSLGLAEATFRAEQRPELIALADIIDAAREVHLHGYGATRKRPGQVWVGVDMLGAPVGLVSFDVANIGRGAAEISRTRLMSLDTAFEGGEAVYWEPDHSVRSLTVVAAAGSAAVDLVLAPQAPSWFYGHMQSHNKFWVEVTYADLGGVEAHTRWFEFRRRLGVESVWFIAQVLREAPAPFTNLPPANPLVED